MAKKKKRRSSVSDLLQAHAIHRQKTAALSWEEKVAIMEKMRDDLRKWRRSR